MSTRTCITRKTFAKGGYPVKNGSEKRQWTPPWFPWIILTEEGIRPLSKEYDFYINRSGNK